MEYLDLAKRRCSTRAYTEQAVEQGKVAAILEAARVAPSAANLQPVRLVIVDDEPGRARLERAANAYGAPLAIIVCADRSRAWRRPADGKSTADIDASIVADHMMMAATDLGLGTVWICWFDPDALAQAFGLPEHLEPVCILAIGYRDEPAKSPERHATERIALDELVFGHGGSARLA